MEQLIPVEFRMKQCELIEVAIIEFEPKTLTPFL